MKIIRLFACALLSFVMVARAAPLSGTRSVGPTGDYASITAAIADVQSQTLGGALVLELQPAYIGSVETFPIVFTNLTTTAANTLTLRPAVGAVALSISSADATAATVHLNGAQFVTIDGRPGGVGSNAGSGGGAASQLTIANTSTSGVALRFINEASGNTLRYTTLRGVNTMNGGGVVVFGSTTGANGNDNNTMDHCDIGDGASTPAISIYSRGTTTTTAQNNSGNTVSNCNVFNFQGAASVFAAGVWLDGGNTDWTVTGNSFYQTATRAAVAATVRAIFVFNASGNNFTVTGNFIGGDSPGAVITTQKWTTTGTTLPYLFQGIYLIVGSTTPSSVQGNTIANIAWTSSSNATSLPGVWSGIYVAAGSVNIGTVTGNTVGSGVGTGSVSVTTSGSGGGSYGICSESSGKVAIANNTIGSVTVNGSTTSISASLTGIRVINGANTISNNTVGSTTTANSLHSATSSPSTTGQQVTGILSSSSNSASITGNTVANLNNSYTGTDTTGQIRGIVTTDGRNTITGNTVRNLSTTSQNVGSAASASVLGISQSSTVPDRTVSQNTVHSLASTAATAAVSVTGIYYSGPTSGTGVFAPISGTNVIARNLVHSLAVSSTTASSVVNGMQFAAGAFTAQNNMVRIGLKADGISTAGASIVRGIYDNGTTAGRNFYHNSVSLGGTQTSGASSTYAFISGGAATYQNNIFVNARSNSPTTLTGKHYAVTIVNPAGLTAGGNLLLASGTGGVLGLYNSIDRSTLAAWQAATGQDATSAVADPLFVNPTGTAATVDLHLQTSTPAERGGIPLTDSLTGAPVTVTDDFDGQTRNTLTPSDVGADAETFTLTSDVFAPGIRYPQLASGSTANRVLTGWATIADNAGVSGGASAPRLYYKKSTNADAFGVANNATGNGWKYVTATGSGSYSFTMDYSLINGGSVSVGDTIQYFVVAQDAANNLGSSPAGSATASGNPAVQNVNGHGAVNSFSIVPLLNGGTVTVGSGGTYPSLSGAGGLFAALNGAVLTGNLVVNITSDLTETGGVTLNQFSATDYPATGNYTLTLQPNSATMRTISGSAANASFITLNGADRVTIDGRFGGSGRYLTFRNTGTGAGASTLLFINDASNNIVRNCVVEGAGTSTSTSVILFRTGTLTGNDNNQITGCQVRDLSTTTGVPSVLVGSGSTSLAVANSGNTVANNELFNFNERAINVAGNDWTLSGNNIYEVNAATTFNLGILMQGDGTNAITDNFIHDLLTTGGGSIGISFVGTSATTIARNLITALNVDAANTTVYGIQAHGSAGSVLNVVNNQIALSPTGSGSTLYGIDDSGATGSVLNAFYNSIVLGGTDSSTANSWASLRLSSSTHTARNNLFLNLRTGGIGNHFAAGSESAGGSYTASHNVYAGSGATMANFMDFSDSPSNAIPVSFATWKSATGDTSTSASNPGGSYSTAMFVSAATGDLHLIPGGNVLVSAHGTPIPGVTDDYDGNPRSATTPTIGSDEMVPSAFSNWAAANGVANDPNALGANGVKNLLNFSFGISPFTGGPGGLQYAGTFAGNGAITATGLPVTRVEIVGNSLDLRALLVRRKDFATAGLTYTPQFSADLSTWQNSAAVVVLADDGVNQIVSVPFPAFIAGQTASFFRVSVSFAP